MAAGGVVIRQYDILGGAVGAVIGAICGYAMFCPPLTWEGVALVIGIVAAPAGLLSLGVWWIDRTWR